MSFRSPRILALGALMLACLGPSPGVAQSRTPEEEARARFELGRSLYEQGRFVEAAAEFEEALELSGRPALHYNIYLAYRDAGRDDEAAASLERYLREVPEDDGQREQLEARLRVLSERAERRTTDRPETSEPERQAPAEEHESGSTASHEQAGTAESSSPIPTVLLVAGGAALTASIVTGLLALEAKSELDGACATPSTCEGGFEDARDRGQALAIATDVLWIGGALSAGLGLALWLASGGEPTEDDARPVVGCGPGGCAAGVRTVF